MVALLSAGCGRIGFGPADGSAPADSGAPADSAMPADSSVSVDSGVTVDSAVASDGALPADSAVPFDSAVPSDGSTTGPAPWEGAFTMDTPEAVDAVNSTATERDCTIDPTGDGLYFSSDRSSAAKAVGSSNFHFSTRPSAADPFGAPVLLNGISSGFNDTLLFAVDGRNGVLSSPQTGGLGGSDIWTVTRASVGDPWEWPGAVNQTAVNSVDAEFDPWMSPDGLRVYFNSNRPSGMGNHDIYMASRATRTDMFGAPTSVGGLNTTAVDANASLSSDELFVVFTSNRGGGAGGYDLYFARRLASTDDFAAPEPVPVVNTPDLDWEPCLGRDGYLYFSSNRPGGMGSSDIYRARFLAAGGS
ncbi:MAG: hypothetical protein DRJ42_17840 [Deltaproteobacteria bacterium]|nr:MAG: hypothetical protein DRJ42_17840 [Deltaproteobacteria bacterium]